MNPAAILAAIAVGREIAQLIAELFAKNGVQPTDQEIADALTERQRVNIQHALLHAAKLAE